MANSGEVARPNARRLEPVTIVSDGSGDEPAAAEDLEDPVWLLPQHQNLYPCEPKFRHSYDCYMRHASLFWSPSETNPRDDRDKFARAPRQLRHIALAAFGCILVGDNGVSEKLARSMSRITPAIVQAAFCNQADRENTHRLVYSKWCDVDTERGAWYRSEDFRRRYTADFDALARRYELDGLAECLYFVMLCELVMFAPFFLIVNYLATMGYAPRVGQANLLVMRDEYEHYVHSRGLLASMRRKISSDFALGALRDMRDTTLGVVQRIVEDYDDGTLSYGHIEAHVRHIVHEFRLDNGLYSGRDEERDDNERLYGATPAAGYLSMAQREFRNNLMESASSIYEPCGEFQRVDMDF